MMEEDHFGIVASRAVWGLGACVQDAWSKQGPYSALPTFPRHCIPSLFSHKTNTSEIFAFKLLLVLTNSDGPKMSIDKICTWVKFTI